MKYLSLGLIASLLVSCSTKDLERCPPGTPGIIVASAVNCTHPDGKFTLPAGLYLPEAQSAKGVYYAAPTPLKSNGIIRHGRVHGGLFIAHEGWQWAWIGHPGFEVCENETSLLGKRGIIMPEHYKFDHYVRYKKQKSRR